MNTLISSSIIVASWKTAGIPVNSSTILAAMSLSATVYAGLQITKPYLFKTLPQKMGAQKLKQFQNAFPEVAPSLIAQAQAEKARLQIDSQQLEAYFISALDSLVLNIPYENRVPQDLLASVPAFGERVLKIEKLKNEALKTKDLSRVAIQLKNERRSLVKLLLQELEKNQRSDILEALKVDDEIGLSRSPDFHRFLIQAATERKQQLYISSVADQAISVGFAGGILLYSTTHWAATGKWP